MLNPALVQLLSFNSEGITVLPVTANKDGFAVVQINSDITTVLSGVKARIGDQIHARMQDGKLVVVETKATKETKAPANRNTGCLRAPERSLT